MQIPVSPEFSGHYIKVIIYFQTKLNKKLCNLLVLFIQQVL